MSIVLSAETMVILSPVFFVMGEEFGIVGIDENVAIRNVKRLLHFAAKKPKGARRAERFSPPSPSCKSCPAQIDRGKVVLDHCGFIVDTEEKFVAAVTGEIRDDALQDTFVADRDERFGDDVRERFHAQTESASHNDYRRASFVGRLVHTEKFFPRHDVHKRKLFPDKRHVFAAIFQHEFPYLLRIVIDTAIQKVFAENFAPREYSSEDGRGFRAVRRRC